jgi:uncharacterized protein (TIGR03000 family)
VTVEGHARQSTRSGRAFRTLALASGESYVYTGRATLSPDDREDVETREVTLTAGQTSRAPFAELFTRVKGAATRSVAGAGR